MASKDRDQIRKLREEANLIRKQEAQRKQRKRVLTQIGIIGGAVVVIAAIAVLVIFGPSWFNPRKEYTFASEVPVTTSMGQTINQPISSLEDGTGVVVGNPDAPVVLDYYFDYSCPHCVSYHQAVGQAFADVVASGDVKINFHPIKFVAAYGTQAAAAMMSIVEHQPELFFVAHDGLFAIPAQTQQGWGQAEYITWAETIGANADSLQSIQDGEFLRWVGSNTSDAQRAGVTGTPSLFINGELQTTLPDSTQLFDIVEGLGADLTSVRLNLDSEG